MERNARGRQRKRSVQISEFGLAGGAEVEHGELGRRSRAKESNPTGLGLPRTRLGIVSVPWWVSGSKWPSALINSGHTLAHVVGERGEREDLHWLALSPRALDRDVVEIDVRVLSASRNRHSDGEKMVYTNSKCQGN